MNTQNQRVLEFLQQNEWLSTVDAVKRGKKKPNWKGNKVGLKVLHKWVRRYLKMPPLCECCGQVPPMDLANISQKYKRNLTDWEWLCRSCHMRKDERMLRLKDKHIEYRRKIRLEKVRAIKFAGNKKSCTSCNKLLSIKKFYIANKKYPHPDSKCKDCVLKRNVLWKQRVGYRLIKEPSQLNLI